ncbi:MAG: hypothetical protein GXP09_09830 [Gammaproteobacteria bacterium]|nr:hypothetical protein [Gammaproteobacteria bacterium]
MLTPKPARPSTRHPSAGTSPPAHRVVPRRPAGGQPPRMWPRAEQWQQLLASLVFNG